jgi:hypothetical protein
LSRLREALAYGDVSSHLGRINLPANGQANIGFPTLENAPCCH